MFQGNGRSGLTTWLLNLLLLQQISVLSERSLPKAGAEPLFEKSIRARFWVIIGWGVLMCTCRVADKGFLT